METDSEIEAEMALAKQVGLVEEDGDGETPHIEDDTQLGTKALETFIQAHDIQCVYVPPKYSF